MVTSFIAAVALVGNQQPVELYRQFKKGETWKYQVRSHLITEQSQAGVSAIPDEVDINYDWTATVKEVDEGGFATVIYKRPVMIQILGETADRPPLTQKIPVDMNVQLKLSPINEITDVLDLAKPDPKKNGGGNASKLIRSLTEAGVPAPTALQLGGFQQDLYQMALMVGSLDSSLDFNPKLPLDGVKIGETWKKTVSYQPQQLKGSNKQAVQRLDMEYKYDGIMEVDGKKVERISATIHLDTDAALYINQLLGTTPGQSGLKSFPLKLDSQITFDLDPKTKLCLKANSATQGSWQILLAGQSQPYQQETLKGRATMKYIP